MQELAKEQHWGQHALARAAELDYAVVHALWHGDASHAEAATLAAIARILHCRPTDLFREDDAPPTGESVE